MLAARPVTVTQQALYVPTSGVVDVVASGLTFPVFDIVSLLFFLRVLGGETASYRFPPPRAAGNVLCSIRPRWATKHRPRPSSPDPSPPRPLSCVFARVFLFRVTVVNRGRCVVFLGSIRLSGGVGGGARRCGGSQRGRPPWTDASPSRVLQGRYLHGIACTRHEHARFFFSSGFGG